MDSMNGSETGVIEFRRYTIRASDREHFARRFDEWFPKALQQVGAVVFGQFLERNDPSGFAWFRGYRDMDARLAANTAFYDGPVWAEHKDAVNEPMLAWQNVLLMQPVLPGKGITLRPAFDPAIECNGARGAVVTQLFAPQRGSEKAFAVRARAAFESYRSPGACEAGVLVTLDVPNNFPRHPVRNDGPHLLWIGVVEDQSALERFLPEARRVEAELAATGMLRSPTETLVLDPTPRSRLRWVNV